MGGRRGPARALWPAVVVLALTLAWWDEASPPEGVRIGPAHEMAEAPAQLREVTAPGDPLGRLITHFDNPLPGYDEVVLQEGRGLAFVSAMDGWLWRIDIARGLAERFVDVPLMAAGARLSPTEENILYFCASHLHGQTYPEDEVVGLYELDLATRAVRPLATRVPLLPDRHEGGAAAGTKVYAAGTGPRLTLAEARGDTGRPLAFCNDLDVSADGERIYFSEPFAYQGASMGGGAFYEAISLGRNGKLWLYDRSKESVSLIAAGYTFTDGVLLETPRGATVEESVLITETTKFGITRLYVSGSKAGQDQLLWQSLPAMPDGLDRDPHGRIWVGMLKPRSELITWIHANPWIKPLMLRLPRWLFPLAATTGVLVLDERAENALYHAVHDGSRIRDIAVAVPGNSRIFLATFDIESTGLYTIPYPDPVRFGKQSG